MSTHSRGETETCNDTLDLVMLTPSARNDAVDGGEPASCRGADLRVACLGGPCDREPQGRHRTMPPKKVEAPVEKPVIGRFSSHLKIGAPHCLLPLVRLSPACSVAPAPRHLWHA